MFETFCNFAELLYPISTKYFCPSGLMGNNAMLLCGLACGCHELCPCSLQVFSIIKQIQALEENIQKYNPSIVDGIPGTDIGQEQATECVGTVQFTLLGTMKYSNYLVQY